MDEKYLRKLIGDVRKGKTGEDEALAALRDLPFADLGHAKVDHHRSLRQGAPEVVFAEGKTREQVAAILEELAKAGDHVLATRVSPEQAAHVKKKRPGVIHNPVGRTLRIVKGKARKEGERGPVLILSGGTSDLPVVEEARETLIWLGVRPIVIGDVGVAGLHRLLAHRGEIDEARAIIVAAGMEGALPSVVGGLVNKPVIGLPTSVGYGAGAGGLSALLGMLNSCASGVVVVNIDNGFGAAFAASRMLRIGEES